MILKNLPKDFIWGTATAAHQVEGNNTNSDFWHLEHTKDTTFAEPSGIACDQWNKYEEDIDIMADHSSRLIAYQLNGHELKPVKVNFLKKQLITIKKF